jgi:thymidylate synthase
MACLIPARNLGDAFQAALAAVSRDGAIVSPRGIVTRELTNVVLEVADAHGRFVHHPSLRYPLIVLKQLMSLCGPLDAAALERYEVPMSDGARSAARIFDDLEQIPTRRYLDEMFEVLAVDPESRQAVLPVFGASSLRTRLPITVALQFLIRENALHATVWMRSNDLWKGFLTDVHLLAFLQEVLAAWLKVEVGTYTHIIASAHVYEKDIPAIRRFLASGPLQPVDPAPPKFSLSRDRWQSEVSRLLDAERHWRARGAGGFEPVPLKDGYLQWCAAALMEFLDSTKFLE